jgi:hypothetical protein
MNLIRRIEQFLNSEAICDQFTINLLAGLLLNLEVGGVVCAILKLNYQLINAPIVIGLHPKLPMN